MAVVSHATGESTAPWRTHTVFNQVPPLEGVDVYAGNLPLLEAVQREGAGWIDERARALGRLVGGVPQLVENALRFVFRAAAFRPDRPVAARLIKAAQQRGIERGSRNR